MQETRLLFRMLGIFTGPPYGPVFKLKVHAYNEADDTVQFSRQQGTIFHLPVLVFDTFISNTKDVWLD
jgi:hypothetical protein